MNSNVRTRESNPKPGKGIWGLTRTDLSVPPFIFAGLGAVFVTLMGWTALGYDPRIHTSRDAIIHYGPILCILPSFLIALLRRPWASGPLWLSVFLLFLPALLHPRDLFTSVRGAKTFLEFLCIPALTEVARLVRGSQSERQT